MTDWKGLDPLEGKWRRTELNCVWWAHNQNILYENNLCLIKERCEHLILSVPLSTTIPSLKVDKETTATTTNNTSQKSSAWKAPRRSSPCLTTTSSWLGPFSLRSQPVLVHFPHFSFPKSHTRAHLSRWLFTRVPAGSASHIRLIPTPLSNSSSAITPRESLWVLVFTLGNPLMQSLHPCYRLFPNSFEAAWDALLSHLSTGSRHFDSSGIAHPPCCLAKCFHSIQIR